MPTMTTPMAPAAATRPSAMMAMSITCTTVTCTNRCTPEHKCSGHEPGHVHGPGCGHEAVPHGDHIDYLVDGHLHHPHGDHCDDHGPIEVVKG